MKSAFATLTFAFSFTLSFAQFQSYDFLVDSVHYEIFQEGNEENGELVEVTIMEKFSSQERNAKYYNIENFERVLYLDVVESIDENEQIISQYVNYADTNFDLDKTVINTYSDQNLIEINEQSVNDDDEFESITIFENLDAFGNHTMERLILSANGEEFKIINQDTFEHQYQNGNLVSTLKRKLNLTTQEYLYTESINYIYNDQDQLIDEEEIGSLESSPRFSYKKQYSYRSNGLIESIKYFYSDLSTENNLLDYSPRVLEKFIYNNLGQIIEVRYYTYTNDQDSYLSDVLYLFRSRGTATAIENTSHQLENILINSFSTLGRLELTIERLDVDKTYQLKIYNEIGKTINQTQIKSSEYWNEYFSLDAGIYFVQIIDKNGRYLNKKIIAF